MRVRLDERRPRIVRGGVADGFFVHVHTDNLVAPMPQQLGTAIAGAARHVEDATANQRSSQSIAGHVKAIVEASRLVPGPTGDETLARNLNRLFRVVWCPMLQGPQGSPEMPLDGWSEPTSFCFQRRRQPGLLGKGKLRLRRQEATRHGRALRAMVRAGSL